MNILISKCLYGYIKIAPPGCEISNQIIKELINLRDLIII